MHWRATMLRKLDDGTYDCEAMMTFYDAAKAVQAIARERGRTLVLRHNGDTWCSINSQSDLRALSQAFNRAQRGFDPTIIGAGVSAVLSPEEELSDTTLSVIKKFKHSQTHRANVWNEIGQNPVYKVYDPLRWESYILTGLANHGDGSCGRADIAAAWRVGCLAQARMDGGKTLRACWDRSLSDANFENAEPKNIKTVLLETWLYSRHLYLICR